MTFIAVLPIWLFIVRFLHQTTTARASRVTRQRCLSSVSYIKPQHGSNYTEPAGSCLSSVSYIKPQLLSFNSLFYNVVYRPFPTSNHNCFFVSVGLIVVVYRPFPTSNHNCFFVSVGLIVVVYRPFPTSNHNSRLPCRVFCRLFIVRFLHQTTTAS